MQHWISVKIGFYQEIDTLKYNLAKEAFIDKSSQPHHQSMQYQRD